MKSKYLVIFLIILAAISGGWPSGTQAVPRSAALEAKLIHIPASSLKENERFVVDARIDGATSRVVYMRLYFKTKNDASFDYVEMTQGSSGYFAELSPRYVSPPELHYFILVLMADQTVITYPTWNPYGHPVVVSIASGAAQPLEDVDFSASDVPESAPAPIQSERSLSSLENLTPIPDEIVDLTEDSPILVLSPEEGEEFNPDEEVVIAVSFIPGDEEIDVNSINLFVDGLNVTLDAEVTENLVTYSASELRPGKHLVLVQSHYVSGVQLPQVSRSFKVLGGRRVQREDPLATGRIFAETRQERISNVGFSDNNLGGFVSGKYGIARYDARFYFTTRENSLFQPRHRYTFNLDLPVLGVTLGDAYPRFNDLILWGKRVRGIYARLHLGFFNVDFIHGETVRKVSPQRSLVLDPVTGLPLQNSALQDSTAITSFGTHRQKVLGIRQSWGSGRHFQLGFNLLKVRDDTTSLAAGEFGTAPKDNLVVGSDLLISLHSRRIELRASGAFSLLSNDISTGPASKADVESQFDVNLPFDPAEFSQYFIINSSTTPLDPRDLTSLAYNVNLRLNYFNNNVQIGYKSVGVQYTSLGNSFLRNNIRGLYFNDRMRL
ncbi:MAG: hypothetical protein ACE5IR_14430, partial [bacterium]